MVIMKAMQRPHVLTEQNFFLHISPAFAAVEHVFNLLVHFDSSRPERRRTMPTS
jgi:hypothetical protein